MPSNDAELIAMVTELKLCVVIGGQAPDNGQQHLITCLRKISGSKPTEPSGPQRYDVGMARTYLKAIQSC